MVFAYFVLPTSPLCAGAGLGNRVTPLWHRTRVRSFGRGLGGFCRIPCYFPSLLAAPPPPLGGWWRIKLTTHNGAQDHLAFCVNFSPFRRHFLALPPVARGMAMYFNDDLFLSLTARPSVIFLSFSAYLAGVTLPFRGVEVLGFEEPHNRLTL